MNIIDAMIILLLLAGAVIGFKRGFTKQLVSFIGIILVVILAFTLKNPISIFLYENLPFFKFGGILKGVTVLNIALYEILAFFIVFSILMILFRILVFATSIFEKILNFTIILGIPSKILGAIVGVVESFVLVFLILYVISLPLFQISSIKESKHAGKILTSTPILSNFAGNTIDMFEEFVELKEKYETASNPMEFNRETLKLFLEYKIVTVHSVDKLVEKNKIQIDNIETILKDYREG